MTDARAVRSRGNRRDFLKTSAAAAAVGSLWAVVAAGAGRRGDPARIRRLEIPAQGPRAEPEIGRRAAHRHLDAPAAFRHPPIRHDQHPRRDDGHVRQFGPPRSARRPDDHPRPGAELGDRQGRQDLYLPLAPGRRVSRRRGTDLGRTSKQRSIASESRPKGSASPAACCSGRSTRSPRPTNTPCSSSWPSRARSISSWGRSPAAGTSSFARRRWRTTTTT